MQKHANGFSLARKSRPDTGQFIIKLIGEDYIEVRYGKEVAIS